MRDGFVKVAAATPDLKVADIEFNTGKIISLIGKAEEKGVRVLVFPELAITGYTPADLFFHPLLIEGAKRALSTIVDATKESEILTFVGLPYENRGKLYNTAAAIFKGKLLGLVPKSNIPSYSEFYETRWFTPSPEKNDSADFFGLSVPFGNKIIFEAKGMSNLKVGVEICEDLWVSSPPSEALAAEGATIICNLSASDEIIGKDSYRKSLVSSTSARLISGYIYSDAGEGESTTDMVFTGNNIICENGTILAYSPMTNDDLTISEIDVDRLCSERMKTSTFISENDGNYQFVGFDMKADKETGLIRSFPRFPFVPQNLDERNERCQKILFLQALGLKKRLEHTKVQSAVIGLSGGLDSTLALLVTVKAFDLLKKDRKDIIAITMPCFGTTKRTKGNAEKLSEALGVSFREIDIKNSVLSHFKDINQSPATLDVTFENSQARERTQVLMDIANQSNGLVVGTGDLSELALGWATFNGDHMSMYGVNAGVPKTLVKYLVSYEADTTKSESARIVLNDILSTPVSPELLPPENGEISQVTEDILGPYELHDFFLYYFVRQSFSPRKIYRIARKTFEGIYLETEIKKWLIVFIRRFFTQQFKRSALPDGPKIGTLTLSPRSDWRMPSDASYQLWLKEAEAL